MDQLTRFASGLNKDNVIDKYYDNKSAILDFVSSSKKLKSRPNDSTPGSIEHIVFNLHNMVYSALTQNYDIALDGREEMCRVNKDLKYHIHVDKRKTKDKLFCATLLQFMIESTFDQKLYLCIDFEYTNKQISLAQLNFEHYTDTNSIIWIINPTELSGDIMNIYIAVLCNRNIYKILHGSDALDVPYIYVDLLNNDPKKITDFTRSLIDTRFMCEYYKINRNDKTDNKCRIYDEDPTRSAVYYFKLIDQAEQNKLQQILGRLPNIGDREWRIDNMSTAQILYAQYDVIFLKYFFYTMIYTASLDGNTVEEKKSIITFYKKHIPEVTQFVYLEKRGISDLSIRCKTEIDPMNNYMIVTNRRTVLKLIDIYSAVSKNIVTKDTHIERLLNIPYYKTPISAIIKKMTYTIISGMTRVYQKKNVHMDGSMNNGYVHSFFRSNEYPYLDNLFTEVSSIIKERVTSIYRNGLTLP